MAFYEIVQCKHCGTYLGHEDRETSVALGFDSDECTDSMRCMARAHGPDSPITQAYWDLDQLRIKWFERSEAAAEQALIDGVRSETARHWFYGRSPTLSA